MLNFVANCKGIDTSQNTTVFAVKKNDFGPFMVQTLATVVGHI